MTFYQRCKRANVDYMLTYFYAKKIFGGKDFNENQQETVIKFYNFVMDKYKGI